jgi:hypothetical protein
MRNSKKSILLLISIILTISIATTVQAQDEEIPDWAEDYADMIPFLGPTLVGLGILVCCIFFLIPLIIAILICVWIYKDAEKRGKQGILWVLLLIVATIIFNILGLIVVIVIWLLVRPPVKGE